MPASIRRPTPAQRRAGVICTGCGCWYAYNPTTRLIGAAGRPFLCYSPLEWA